MIDVEKFRLKGRPRTFDEPMQQIAVRLPSHLLEAIDAVIDDREGQSDRASVIREAIAKGLKDM
jgi:metal-responsive CopG/Arc/MetJ family transcriptional regulator